MGKGSAPAAPDYTGAAVAQGQANVEAVRKQAELNRINQYTPLGSQVYTDLGNDKWQSDINLTPQGQQLFDSSLQGSQGMQDTANSLLEKVQGNLSTPLTVDPTQPYGPQNSVIDALYGQYKSRLDPQWQMEEQRNEQQLANKGFQMGTEGYTKAMDDFSRRRTDAYGSALNSAIDKGAAARQQAISEALLQQNQPMNLLSALRSGSQVSMPSFSNAGTSVGAPGAAPIMDATVQGYNSALGQYNANTASSNSTLGGLFGLGKLGLAAYSGGVFSDLRLKRILSVVGKLASGLKLYAYEYLWSPVVRVGVIAQEVLATQPEAVLVHPSGYLMVDYGRVV